MTTLPTPDIACAIARHALGWPAATARRFTTGMAFFVYEVAHGDDLAVVRIGRPEQAEALEQGRRLMQQLRPLGVPLPALFAAGAHHGLPYLVMARLPGTDLGHVINALPPARLRGIAEAVAEAQRATATAPRGHGFGYAATPDAAPHRRWTGVIAAHIDRSRRRLIANGLFPLSVIAPLEDRLGDHAAALDAMEPVPFLHDTTTKNVIVAPDGTLAGIVDVDDLCYGDPRYPAALTAAALLAWGGPQHYVAAWLAHAGLARDRLFDFYVATFLLDFMSEQGMAFNGNEAPADPDLCRRLSRLLADVLDAT